jgi:hypothetical protein
VAGVYVTTGLPRVVCDKVRLAERRLTERFARRIEVNPDLDRTLVSFQANKKEEAHRWCPYREGFSAALMRYVFERTGLRAGRILDPFAGSGTALFAASKAGIDSVGIEFLPCSAEIIEVRRLVAEANAGRIAAAVRRFRRARRWEADGPAMPFPHIRITRGAFSEDLERQLGRYRHEVERVRDPVLRRLLRFAALCVLETISFTRKDGQYLRWDSRSGRKTGRRRFDKGPIPAFTPVIEAKLDEIADDLAGAAAGKRHAGRIEFCVGSCLDLLPTFPARSFDGIVTSPPYCNRYDYTRTYALELAFLGVDETRIRSLRQAMLSCTVENRAKDGLEERIGRNTYVRAMAAVESQEVLGEVAAYLDVCRAEGRLNNPGIPRMVRNYFREMALIIFEGERLLKPGAPFVMVNDNVRYAGAHIPVDLILSDLAEKAGLEVDVIWALPRGKGNSSQQMGRYGREELRKSVCVWRAGRASASRLPADQERRAEKHARQDKQRAREAAGRVVGEAGQHRA